MVFLQEKERSLDHHATLPWFLCSQKQELEGRPIQHQDAGSALPLGSFKLLSLRNSCQVVMCG